MQIGNQIKQLRRRRSITQESLAQHLGVTAQAVSKWERGVATPDIAMLPEISAFFGVTIDTLFSIDDDTRMERIQNMLWNNRYLDPNQVDDTRVFLLEKAKQESSYGAPYELLAEMENHLAREHHEKAEEYAKEALRRDPNLRIAHAELNIAMGGRIPDWNGCNHYLQIAYYIDFVHAHPNNWRAYMWLMDQLIDDYRLDEAQYYCDLFNKIDCTYRVDLYRGMIAWQRGQHDEAFKFWHHMEVQFPNEWCVLHHIGDYLVRSGRYDEGMAYYKRAMDVQKSPPLVDPLQVMAQLCEIRGDIASAIAAKKEEAMCIEHQWQIRGEELDSVQRDIQRLEKML